MITSEQFLKLYPAANTIAHVGHDLPGEETEDKQRKKNVNSLLYQWEDKKAGYICGLKAECLEENTADPIVSEEDCEWKQLVESCTSCQIRSSNSDFTECGCTHPQCVCNQVKPPKTRKYNSLYKRVVFPSYEAFYRKTWWGQKTPDSQIEVQRQCPKPFLNMYLKTKPSELLTATSVYNLPADSDEDSTFDREDINESSFYISQESLDLSGRKSKRRSMKAKEISTDSASFNDGLNCYKMFLHPERSVCLQYPYVVTLPGLILDLYCPKTRECIREKLMAYIQEHKAKKNKFSEFWKYIFNKHFKKHPLRVNEGPTDPCRMKELFAPKKKKKNSKKRRNREKTAI